MTQRHFSIKARYFLQKRLVFLLSDGYQSLPIFAYILKYSGCYCQDILVSGDITNVLSVCTYTRTSPIGSGDVRAR